jgi:integrase/recombinase XerC
MDRTDWRAYAGFRGGRPRRIGPLLIHASTSARHQIGPIASTAAGSGKSSRAVYLVAVRLLTPRRAATSANPTTCSRSDIRAAYGVLWSTAALFGENVYDVVILLPGLANQREVLAAYDSALARQGRAEATRVKYVHGVHVFLDWAAANLVEGVTAFDVDRFLGTWEADWASATGSRPSRATVRARIAALRSFFAYLERAGLLLDQSGRPAVNPMAAVIAPALELRPNDFLRPIEDHALLHCPSPPSERFVVWLLRWTGLRVSEACALKLQDIDLAVGRESIVVRKSKTAAGVRTVPLVPPLLPELAIWLEALRDRGFVSPQAPVLATASGAAFKPTFVWRLVKRAAFRADVRPIQCTCGSRRRTLHYDGCSQTRSGENVSEITPHTLRRTFGSYLLNKGLRLEVVSPLLGHSSTVVTERAYAELLGSTIRDELLSVLGDGR